MNGPLMAALLRDAIYQILDNRVFRILAILVLLPILFTLIVGFREDHISILFGWYTYDYDALMELLMSGTPGMVLEEGQFQEVAIEAAAGLLVNEIAGLFGIFLAISATAFFVPRMLEKGAADVLFHKPVSRGTLLVSRYFAGLLFVAILAIVLVTGVWLGFLIGSGYNKPSVFWGALTLTYLFGLIHAVSVCMGVFTRSTVATILLALIFFWGTGCIVHTPWKIKEYNRVQDQSSGEEQEEKPGWLKGLIVVLDVAHYVLPKTSDADVISYKLQDSFEKSTLYWHDEDLGFVIKDAPPGAEALESPGSSVQLDPSVAAELGTPRATARGPRASLTVLQRPRREIERRTRTSLENRSQAWRALADVIEEAPDHSDPEHETVEFSPPQAFALPTTATRVDWIDRSSGAARERSAFVMQTKDEIVTLLLDAEEGFRESPEGAEYEEWLPKGAYLEGSSAAYSSGGSNHDIWYLSVFGLRSELRYNALFSVGSSLAFTIFILLVASWRLRRIDF